MFSTAWELKNINSIHHTVRYSRKDVTSILAQGSSVLTNIVVEPLKVRLHREEMLIKEFEQEGAVCCQIRGTIVRRGFNESNWSGFLFLSRRYFSHYPSRFYIHLALNESTVVLVHGLSPLNTSESSMSNRWSNSSSDAKKEKDVTSGMSVYCSFKSVDGSQCFYSASVLLLLLSMSIVKFRELGGKETRRCWLFQVNGQQKKQNRKIDARSKFHVI